MTTSAAVPAIRTLVELTVSDEPFPGVRIDEIRGNRLVLTLPPGRHRPTVGRAVTLRWSAAPRGRAVVTGTVVDLPQGRLTVELDGPPEIEQHRRHVRGGGGEEIVLRRVGAADEATGWVCNISEQGVRARFGPDVTVLDGDILDLTITLDQATIAVRATALQVSLDPGEQCRPDSAQLDVIAVFAPDETQAQAIRRYVLQQQLLSRRLVEA